MNFDLNNGIPNLYDGLNNKLSGANPTILIVISVLVIFYYVVFSSLGVSTQNIAPVNQKTIESLTATEVFFWAIFIFLVLINGLQYFFDVDIQAAVKNIFSPTPEIDITNNEEGKGLFQIEY